ncbi:MAG: [LysW]-lysine hydrolase [Halobacteriota archaeon]|uniref:[LysW]-lysine hydrolase n=1 Tax=Halodesulfurarchaeum sp. HSR-GB TaxID=3074077 RepID=UPI00285637F6|nr:[LysW]-lysine hydrolase [Halodesulfurarchaeum sp. HSR-GB]MDR5657560.1 [LysW]-lysine hydrolase [Halodesulfurarchaeum sp. HSR-GB]
MSDVTTKEARALLRNLVETPSVSGSEDAVAKRLRSFFEAQGREAWIDDVGNLRAPADDTVLLTSHMDTVPGEIPVRVEEDVLWGRGSVDAKGPLAAMAVAAANAGVSFVGVVREETDSAGARYLIEDRDPPAAVVNGEPSGWDAITLGYRGLLSGTYTVETEVGHTSRPEPNAIQQAVAWWSQVEAAFGDGDSVFDRVTPKPVAFEGGTSADGFAFEAQVEAQFRIPPGETIEGVKSTVEAVGPGSVAWHDEIPPVMESPRNPVAGALRRGIRECSGEPTHLRKTGTSDMNVYAGAWDVPMATYGPGDSDLDHTPDEHLDLGAFDRAVRVLTVAAGSL